jgi:TP901 family phage tail tape measure protein
MTAIWNNFAEGSTNLEYYADVLTKLGAETAASTDEISEGLEKFAAVAKTIDLSYETATASVATIIDKTK